MRHPTIKLLEENGLSIEQEYDKYYILTSKHSDEQRKWVRLCDLAYDKTSYVYANEVDAIQGAVNLALDQL